ncbi:MAG: hypothetical protein HWE20_10785 [Gammaproteobacteria bacterium]|nr:hypothetical protein [Gammaproteobacteria bacterium]
MAYKKVMKYCLKAERCELDFYSSSFFDVYQMLRRVANYTSLTFIIAGLALHMGHVQSQTSDYKSGRNGYVSMGCVGCHGGAGQAVPLNGQALGAYSYNQAMTALKQRMEGVHAHPTLRVIGANIEQQNIRDLAAYLSQK